MGFPTQNDYFGVFGGVPLFKETPISQERGFQFSGI